MTALSSSYKYHLKKIISKQTTVKTQNELCASDMTNQSFSRYITFKSQLID